MIRYIRGPKGGHIGVANCANCGKEIRRNAIHLRGKQRPACSQKCRGILLRTSDDYLAIDYKDKKGKRRSSSEHRRVMEKHLGRRLKKSEIVHHKDENRRNNAVSNLQVMTRAEHMRIHAKGASWNLKQARRLLAMGWSFNQIGLAVGASPMTVFNYLVRHGFYQKGARNRGHRSPGVRIDTK
jgi:endogenous inhibitor of DNA gyrase (YacG/DUF329 family)